MPDATTSQSAYRRLIELTMDGWVVMGGYIKKWFFYNIYAISIYLGFIGYFMLVMLIWYLGAAFHDLLGIILAVFAFLLLPAILGFYRDRGA